MIGKQVATSKQGDGSRQRSGARPSASASKSPGNVRLRPREETLSSEGSPAKLGWAWTLSKIVVGASLVLGLGAATALLVQRFLMTSPRFALDQVHVVGSRHFGEDELLGLASAKRGQNLFALDLARAESQLLQVPWIREAHVTRQLPNTLSIEVREYLPAALAAIDGTLFLVTREGHPIKEAAVRDEVDYPIITGITGTQLGSDRERAIERIALALDVEREYERLPLSGTYPTEEIHLGADGRLDLVVGQKGMSLRLGKGPFRQKLLMASRVIGNLRGRGQVPAIVFLDNEAHPERVVARMR